LSDDLIYNIFKEIAVLEGKRTVDGEWKVDNSQEISRILSKAFTIVRKAASPKADKGAGGVGG